MKYTKEWVIDQAKNGKSMTFLPFWGQTANPGKVGKHCFSQWFPCEFTVDGVQYHTSEQYMMSQKALLFNDQETYQKIMAADNPADYKALGRQICNFQQDIWDAKKFSIVVQGNVAKFGQNHALLEYLLSTGRKIPVEASLYDDIWGVKLGIDRPEIHDPGQWLGENLLGFALMEARDILREQQRRCKNSERLYPQEVDEEISYEYYDNPWKEENVWYEWYLADIDPNPYEDENYHGYWEDYKYYHERTLIILGEDVPDDLMDHLVQAYHHDGDEAEIMGEYERLVVPQVSLKEVLNWTQCVSAELRWSPPWGMITHSGHVRLEDAMDGFLHYFWMYEPEIAEEYLELLFEEMTVKEGELFSIYGTITPEFCRYFSDKLSSKNKV